jgi:uncharacterized protein YbjT (DUF2867 family)
MNLDGKTILITGGTGSFGTALIARILDEHEPSAPGSSRVCAARAGSSRRPDGVLGVSGGLSLPGRLLSGGGELRLPRDDLRRLCQLIVGCP